MRQKVDNRVETGQKKNIKMGIYFSERIINQFYQKVSEKESTMVDCKERMSN